MSEMVDREFNKYFKVKFRHFSTFRFICKFTLFNFGIPNLYFKTLFGATNHLYILGVGYSRINRKVFQPMLEVI